MKFERVFAMPSAETFSIKPIGQFVGRWMHSCPGVSVDPFARNKQIATFTNDIDPSTSASLHLDAEDFCRGLVESGVICQIAMFDPPYSPRQISECYKGFGREVTARDTQNAALYRRVRDALDPLVPEGGGGIILRVV